MKMFIGIMIMVMVFLGSTSAMAEQPLKWPSYENSDWADERAISACGNSFIFGMDVGFGTMSLSQIRKLTELETFRRTWMLKIDDPMLCEMANRLLPEYYGVFYWSFMKDRFPNGWPGDLVPLKKKQK